LPETTHQRMPIAACSCKGSGHLNIGDRANARRDTLGITKQLGAGALAIGTKRGPPVGRCMTQELPVRTRELPWLGFTRSLARTESHCRPGWICPFSGFYRRPFVRSSRFKIMIRSFGAELSGSVDSAHRTLQPSGLLDSALKRPHLLDRAGDRTLFVHSARSYAICAGTPALRPRSYFPLSCS
jgi:hypothetical protein